MSPNSMLMIYTFLHAERGAESLGCEEQPTPASLASLRNGLLGS